MTTTTTTTECEVADQIVRWDDVQAGDLVLHEGELRLVEQRMLNTLRPDIKVSFRLRGVEMWQTFRLEGYTAVRRYMETEPDALRQQVQQARNDYHEAGCDHSDMTGHGAQEERAWGAVQALDEVLGWLAESPAGQEG